MIRHRRPVVSSDLSEIACSRRHMILHRQPIVLAGLAMLTGGCAALPPNTLRLYSPESSPPSMNTITFTRGGGVGDERACAVLLVSPVGALLFDAWGPHNRFELMIEQGPQFALYDRIGLRPAPLQHAPPAPPVGIALARIGNELRGHVDVFVGRSLRDPDDPSFERYPQTLRVVGYVVVPVLGPDAPGAQTVSRQLLPATHDEMYRAASGAASRPTGASGPYDNYIWQLEPGLLLEEAAHHVPRLPAITARLPVPSTFDAPFQPRRGF